MVAIYTMNKIACSLTIFASALPYKAIAYTIPYMYMYILHHLTLFFVCVTIHGSDLNNEQRYVT